MNAPSHHSSTSARPDPISEAARAKIPALSGVLRAAVQDSKLTGLATHIGEADLHVQGPDAVWPFVVGTIAQRAPVLVVTATGRQAEDLTAMLRHMIGDQVEMFPSWETLPHERLSPGVETVGTRMRVLRRLQEGGTSDVRVVVAPTRAVVQPIQKHLGGIEPVHVAEGEELDFEEVQDRLVQLGYSHVDVVGKRGQFATRGGLLDIFPSTAELPIRVEFWGDEVSEVRSFSVGDQRTIAGSGPGAEHPSVVDIYPLSLIHI